MHGQWQSPFSAQPVGLPELQEPMLLVAVTEFVANTAAFVYFTAGALRRNITAEMVWMGAELLPHGVLAVVPPCPQHPNLCCLPAPAALPPEAEHREHGQLCPTGGNGVGAMRPWGAMREGWDTWDGVQAG